MKIEIVPLDWEHQEDSKSTTAKTAVGTFTISAADPLSTLFRPVVLRVEPEYEFVLKYENLEKAKDAATEIYHDMVVKRMNETLFGGSGLGGTVIARVEP